jgi:8-oxo-dGTP pyrophosphatase MutT (NUDIX family)
LIPSTPRAAASVLLLRDAPEGLEVLLLERTSKAAFMPSLWVFPGGRVDPADVALAGAVDPLDPRAARVAAVRETLEEVDIWLGDPAVETAARAAVAGHAPWHDVRGVPEMGLSPYARWVTPAGEGRRYDTWFFLARVPDAAVATPDGAEATRSGWLRPRDVLRAGASTYPLAPPTFVHLLRLRDVPTVAEALALPCELDPIEPVRHHVDGTLVFSLPGCPVHGGAPRRTTPARVVWAGDGWQAE